MSRDGSVWPWRAGEAVDWPPRKGKVITSQNVCVRMCVCLCPCLCLCVCVHFIKEGIMRKLKILSWWDVRAMARHVVMAAVLSCLECSTVIEYWLDVCLKNRLILKLSQWNFCIDFRRLTTYTTVSGVAELWLSPQKGQPVKEWNVKGREHNTSMCSHSSHPHYFKSLQCNWSTKFHKIWCRLKKWITWPLLIGLQFSYYKSIPQ